MINARQSVRVSRDLGDDHYKRIPCVTVGVACQRNLTAQWPWVPSIGQNLQPFTGNGDVSIWVTNSRVGPKSPKNKETNIIVNQMNSLTYPSWGGATRTVCQNLLLYSVLLHTLIHWIDIIVFCTNSSYNTILFKYTYSCIMYIIAVMDRRSTIF